MNLSSMKTPSKSFGICLEDDLHLHHRGRLPQFCNTPQTTVEALGDLSCQVSCYKPPVKGEEPIGSERILALGVPGSFKTKLLFFLKKLSRCIEYPPWNYIQNISQLKKDIHLQKCLGILDMLVPKESSTNHQEEIIHLYHCLIFHEISGIKRRPPTHQPTSRHS